MVVPKGGGGSGWHKIAMWQMHITPSLWPIKCSGQGGDRGGIYARMANTYHTKSLADCSGQGGERWNLC